MGTKIEIKVLINDYETDMGSALHTTETIPEAAMPYTIKCMGLQYFNADVGCFARLIDKESGKWLSERKYPDVTKIGEGPV